VSRKRSPSYPSCGLTEAVNLARKIWTKEQNTAVSPDVAAKAMGYNSLSGPARTYVATLKQFGLLSRDKHGLKLSQLAVEILHAANETERLHALRQAALKPEIFKRLNETHIVASEDALRSHLITRMGFSETGARRLAESFRDTVAFAKLNEQVYSPFDRDGESEAGMTGSTAATPETRSGSTTRALRSFSWPLSAETVAKLEIFGDEELTSAHIDALTQYLEVAKKLLKSPRS